MSEELEVMENKPEKMNIASSVGTFFTEPGKFFENLRIYPNWIVPVVISVLVTIIFSWFVRDIMFEYQKEMMYENSFISEEAKDAAIEAMENKSETRQFIEIIGWGTAGIFINLAFLSAVFMVVGNFVLGGMATFKQMFSMVSWAGLIGSVEALVRLPMVLIKNSIHAYTSLAVLMDVSQNKTFLFQFLDIFDIFTIWHMVILAIGINVIYKFSSKTGYITIISLYLIYFFVKFGLSQLF